MLAFFFYFEHNFTMANNALQNCVVFPGEQLTFVGKTTY